MRRSGPGRTGSRPTSSIPGARSVRRWWTSWPKDRSPRGPSPAGAALTGLPSLHPAGRDGRARDRGDVAGPGGSRRGAGGGGRRRSPVSGDRAAPGTPHPPDPRPLAGRVRLSHQAQAPILERRGGARGLGALIARLGPAGGFDAALRQTYHVTEGDFEERWQRDLSAHYGWLAWAQAVGVFWALLGLLMVWLVVVRRRRDRLRRARLDEGWTLPPDETPTA